jgi:hypothetical protein
VRIADSTGAKRPEHEEETLAIQNAGEKEKDALRKTNTMPP